MTKQEQLQEIHNSMINGQRRQAVNQIDGYDLYNFFSDYDEYLKGFYSKDQRFNRFKDAVISYFRIKKR